MHNQKTIENIRQQEKLSHTQIYTSEALFHSDSWLGKPVKTVLELLPRFDDLQELRILDLGCGVGRNCIPIASHFHGKNCVIECVDLLEVAVEKLAAYAAQYQVGPILQSTVCAIEDYPIPAARYDWIIAVSSLEHVDSPASLIRILSRIHDGLREHGIVCLIMNSGVTEQDKETQTSLPPQFEVNLPTETLLSLLHKQFQGWKVIQSGVKRQTYEIPRGGIISQLCTNVVTFVAQK